MMGVLPWKVIAAGLVFFLLLSNAGANEARLSLAGERDGETASFNLSWGRLDLDVVKRTGADGIEARPRLQLRIKNKIAAAVYGEWSSFGRPRALVQIVEMDSGNAHTEVALTTFTGGAHCCRLVRLLTQEPKTGNWHVVEAGAFDGEIVELEDADGDGRHELVVSDRRFLYTFSSYAGSFPPISVMALESGVLTDVTSERRFRPRHRRHLERVQEEIANGFKVSEPNGLLAGYAATKALLGEFLPAWDNVKRHYDPAAKDGLTSCVGEQTQSGDCTEQVVHPDFPSALLHLLKQAGYVQ